MKKWEIRNYPIPSEDDPHPFVILSPNALCGDDRKKDVNGLMCTSLRPDMQVKDFQVRLNGNDGLDGPTVVDCSFVYILRKSKAGPLRGVVTVARRHKITHLTCRVIQSD